MEDEGVQVVLAKAIDLRLKICNCIRQVSTNIDSHNRDSKSSSSTEKRENIKSPNSLSEDGLLGEAEEEEEEGERLLHIRDALESLEHQLSNLQALQQQQCYEREVALGEIEHSRKTLLDKLKDYKGKELEVIQEAFAFAGETVEHNNDLRLPPYPTRARQSLFTEIRHLSHLPSARKSMLNGVVTSETKKKMNGTVSDQTKTSSKISLGNFVGAAAKAAITVVGIISLLSLSGFGPNLGRRSGQLRLLGMFQQPAIEEKNKEVLQCPPGRVLVVENGESRCIVKERVAIPFEAVDAKPDVNYGCG